MPGLDHPVHEKVREKAGAKYGCHNRRQFSKGYWAPQRRFYPDGSFEVVSVRIPHAMSKECRYDKSLADSKCKDCQHAGTGEAYAKLISENGS